MSSRIYRTARRTNETFDAMREIAKHVDLDAMRWFCTAHENEFEAKFDATRVTVANNGPHDFYLFKDNGARVLAVAHLDTVSTHDERMFDYARTAAGTVVYSRSLDDRLGAYVIADLLPRLGITCDLLFTVGEEVGASTAHAFNASDHHDRTYDWIIEFDRGGTDVVLYEYENDEMIELVTDSGAVVAEGIFSDISYMEHVGVKAFNWGVGYRDYHDPDSHVWIDDTVEMVSYFLNFYEANHGTHLPHVARPSRYGSSYRGGTVFSQWTGHSEDGCDEAEWDPEACEGDLTETQYGTLCKAHRSWYSD